MEKLKDLLEQDREPLLRALAGAETAESAISVMDRELTRLQNLFQQENEDLQVADEASFALQAARGALSFADSTGETVVYERRESPEEKQSSSRLAEKGMTAAGMLMCVFAVLFGTAAGGASRPFWVMPSVLCLMAAGLFCVIRGRRSLKLPVHGKSRNEAGKKPLVLVRPDGDKLFHSLLALLTFYDGRMEELQGRTGKQALGDKTASGMLETEEQSMLCRLLELLYGRKEDPQAAEMIGELRYYLHRKRIEAVDYTPEHGNWFDVMPSSARETLRPALVQEGVLLAKGLAVDNPGR